MKTWVTVLCTAAGIGGLGVAVFGGKKAFDKKVDREVQRRLTPAVKEAIQQLEEEGYIIRPANTEKPCKHAKKDPILDDAEIVLD